MKKKKSIWKVFLILVLVICLGASCAFCYILNKDLKQKESDISLLQYEIDANKQTVYVAKQFIYAGEKLEAGVNVVEQQIVTGLEAFNYITADQLGSFARIDIAQNMPILTSMVATMEVSQDTREYEMLICNLATDQLNYDVVDVRIQFPNGDEYVLLSKKTIYNLSIENSLFTTHLNEEEILRVASATVDAYIHTGTRIYTTRYVEPTLQDALIPNYPVKANIVELINTDPNVLTKAELTLNENARLNLETRLMNLSEEWIEAIIDGRQNGYANQQAIKDAIENQSTVKNEADVEGIDANEVFGNDYQQTPATTTPTTTTEGVTP